MKTAFDSLKGILPVSENPDLPDFLFDNTMVDMEQLISRLEYLCTVIPPLLHGMNEETFSCKSSPGKWSKKEIIGHLIDSAANNHQRFVRTQFEDCPVIIYDQDKWNAFGFYQQIESCQLIEFWTVYNRQLAALIKCIPEESRQKKCETGGGQKHTIEFLIHDYVEHLEHHLRQVVVY